MQIHSLAQRLFRFAWLLAYVLFIALVIGGLCYGRQAALRVYGSRQAQEDWNEWREDARQMAEAPSSVKRRVPKSAQPPALVLMRDHFAVCLGGAVVLSTVLFGTFMVLVRGALMSGEQPLK